MRPAPLVPLRRRGISRATHPTSSVRVPACGSNPRQDNPRPRNSAQRRRTPETTARTTPELLDISRVAQFAPVAHCRYLRQAAPRPQPGQWRRPIRCGRRAIPAGFTAEEGTISLTPGPFPGRRRRGPLKGPTRPNRAGVGVQEWVQLPPPATGADRGMYFILRLTQLIVRPDSRSGVLRYKSPPNACCPTHSVIPAWAGIQGWWGRFVAIISFLHTPVSATGGRDRSREGNVRRRGGSNLALGASPTQLQGQRK